MSKPRIPRAKSLRERLAMDANVNADLQSQTQTFAESNDEPLAHTHTETQTQQKTSAITQQESQSVQQTNVFADALADSQTRTQAHKNQQANVDVNMQADPFVHVKQALGQKKDKLENLRKRQTFWLSEEDIKAIEELNAATGLPKYQIVSEAIQAMYRHVLGGHVLGD